MSGRYEPMGRQQLERAEEEDVLRQLVAARGAGDLDQMRDAMAVFVQGRYAQLMAMARLKLPGEHDAEDVVGETIISALRSLEPERAGFEGSRPGELGAWLLSILGRRTADHFRREARRIKADSLDQSWDEDDVSGPIHEPLALTADPAAEVPIHDAHERVMRALSPAHRGVVELWWRERLPASEIIDRLRQSDGPGVDVALTVDNVHQIISRYRAKMRRALEVGS